MAGINAFGGLQSSYFQTLYGNSGIGGLSSKYDYAAQNKARLQSILQMKDTQETARGKQLLDYRKTASSFYSDFYPVMGALKSSASQLSNTSMTSVLKPMGYGSSNSSAVTGVSGNLDSGTSVSVNVKQAAARQTSTFAAVKDTDKGAFAGKGSLEFSVNGKNHSVSLEIGKDIANKDALGQIAEQINGLKAGISASVVTADGKSSLQVTSDKTGESAAFTLKASGSFTNLGDATVQKAKNAIYSVDGGADQMSESNQIKLKDGKLSATLSGTGTAVLSKQAYDSSAVLKSVQQFAKDYNAVVNTLNSHAGKSSAIENLASSFGNIKFQSSSLSSVGINVDGAGRMTVNAEKFQSALQKDPGKVGNLLGSSGGLASTTYRRVSEAVVNSGKLVQPPKSVYNRFTGSTAGLLLDISV